MNGRKKKLYRSYGLNLVESKEAIKKIREAYENQGKIESVFCGYMKDANVGRKQKEIIQQARYFNLARKHAGSKPLHKLQHAIKVMNAKVSKYVKAMEALQKLQEENKENVN